SNYLKGENSRCGDSYCYRWCCQGSGSYGDSVHGHAKRSRMQRTQHDLAWLVDVLDPERKFAIDALAGTRAQLTCFGVRFFSKRPLVQPHQGLRLFEPVDQPRWIRGALVPENHHLAGSGQLQCNLKFAMFEVIKRFYVCGLPQECWQAGLREPVPFVGAIDVRLNVLTHSPRNNFIEPL